MNKFQSLLCLPVVLALFAAAPVQAQTMSCQSAANKCVQQAIIDNISAQRYAVNQCLETGQQCAREYWIDNPRTKLQNISGDSATSLQYEKQHILTPEVIGYRAYQKSSVYTCLNKKDVTKCEECMEDKAGKVLDRMNSALDRDVAGNVFGIAKSYAVMLGSQACQTAFANRISNGPCQSGN